MPPGPGDPQRLAVSAALSCGIYLLPIATVHWTDLFGWVLIQELSSDRATSWKATDITLALLLQAVLFAGVWWVLPKSRAAAIGATALLLIPGGVVLNIAYLLAIPSYFLIESDTAPDMSTWTEACAIEGYSLDPVRGGTSRGLERSGAAWVRADNGTQYGILRMPGCVVDRAAIPDLAMAPGLYQALSDGSVVYVTMERGSPVQMYWLLRRGAREPRPLKAPAGQIEGPPMVSDDGEWAAWLIRSPEREASLRIEPLAGGDPVVFSHPLLQNTTLVPVELDMTTREVIVNRGLSSFVRLRLDGQVAWGPLEPGAIEAQTDTFRFLDGQWTGWDAYVEDSRYRLGWSTHAGRGQYDAPRGRSITSAAMDPRGRYVAVSTTSSLNIGAIADTLLAISASDGKEVFRKTLSMYTRSQVAFLGDRYFAYSDIVEGRSRTLVLRVTDSAVTDRAPQN